MKEKYINNQDYLILSPITDLSLTISIQSDNNQVRKLISKDEILKIINFMPNIPIIDVDDRLVENEYKKYLQSNSNEKLISIIKTAYLRNQERIKNKKKSSDKDEYYFNLAEKYLYTEFSYVLNLSVEEVKEYIINTLKNYNN